MEISNLIPHIEALIFASEKPLTTLEITDLINQAFGFMEDKIMLDQIESAIEGILEKYKAEFYPFEVRESGGGWQFLTKRDFHKTVAQLNGDKFLKRLSTAALETLSIIAYKQPVTKSEIESIRGVSSDYAIQKLLEKDLIVITGRNEALPGHPLVYGTSKNFMDYFGLNSAEDLPKLKEVFDDSMVAAPTAIGDVIITPSTEGEDTEETTPSLNGIHLNGTDVTDSEENEGGEGGEEEGTTAALGQDIVDENAETTDEGYELDTDEEAIAEEAEALDEEAGEVLDEIAEEGYDEEGDEEEAFNNEGEEEEEGFEDEEPYITPEEEEAYADDDSTTFKVGEDGELIEEHNGSDDDEADEEEAIDEEDEEEPGDEDTEHDKDDEKK
ncbi:SMC-Scp complex subunit ScpB [Niastella vici]|uniref:SMC-Scp complex subunit ScpB n=1 Tax=Niastella vici TaxID=1703345 RepID=A0A1V9G102_9BACT|nr:SMC-Scp complex subunit ScpB [Niastella vici]OQP64319.1 SMC-Scp complex subunit ScpB [Niastella vici]